MKKSGLLLAAALFLSIGFCKAQRVKVGKLTGIECYSDGENHNFKYRDYKFTSIVNHKTFTLSNSATDSLYSLVLNSIDTENKLELSIEGHLFLVKFPNVFGAKYIRLIHEDSRTGNSGLSRDMSRKQFAKLFGKNN